MKPRDRLVAYVLVLAAGPLAAIVASSRVPADLQMPVILGGLVWMLLIRWSLGPQVALVHGGSAPPDQGARRSGARRLSYIVGALGLAVAFGWSWLAPSASQPALVAGLVGAVILIAGRLWPGSRPGRSTP